MFKKIFYTIVAILVVLIGFYIWWTVFHTPLVQDVTNDLSTGVGNVGTVTDTVQNSASNAVDNANPFSSNVNPVSNINPFK